MRRREFIVGVASSVYGRAANAQQSRRTYRIAIVHPSTPTSEMSEAGGHPFYGAFFEEMRRLGYDEGRNLEVARYSGGGLVERYAELAREVVRGKPEVIVTNTSRMILNFKSASDTIPIVAISSDPVALGIAASLARPGGSYTGVSSDTGPEVYAKELEVLKEALPTLSNLGFIATPAFWGSSLGLAMRDAAERLGILIVFGKLNSHEPTDYRNAFAAMAQKHVDAVLFSEQAEHFSHRQLIVELAETHKLPTMTAYLEIVEIGGLIAYAPDRKEAFRHLAIDVDKILRGANPGEIPIYLTVRYRLAINLKTAKALGVAIPDFLIARADEVIE